MKADYVCRICARAVRYVPSRFAYVHVSRLPDGYPDHGPIPAKSSVTGRTIEVHPVSGALLE